MKTIILILIAIAILTWLDDLIVNARIKRSQNNFNNYYNKVNRKYKKFKRLKKQLDSQLYTHFDEEYQKPS